MLSIKDFYSKYPYPNHEKYVDSTGKVRSNYYSIVRLREDLTNKKILVIGCGTIEALFVARDNPGNQVIGIDLSQTSLDICRDLADRENISNLELIQGDFLETSYDKEFILILASGVLHHNKRPRIFLEKINNSLKDNGWLFGFVYDREDRKTIRSTRHYLKKYDPDPRFVQDYLKDLPLSHESRVWYDIFEKTDVEIADTWLNPYAVHYTPKRLEILLKGNGFKSLGDDNIIFRKETGKMIFGVQKI